MQMNKGFIYGISDKEKSCDKESIDQETQKMLDYFAGQPTVLGLVSLGQAFLEILNVSKKQFPDDEFEGFFRSFATVLWEIKDGKRQEECV